MQRARSAQCTGNDAVILLCGGGWIGGLITVPCLSFTLHGAEAASRRRRRDDAVFRPRAILLWRSSSLREIANVGLTSGALPYPAVDAYRAAAAAEDPARGGHGGLAIFNRYVLVPRLARDASAQTRFARHASRKSRSARSSWASSASSDCSNRFEGVTGRSSPASTCGACRTTPSAHGQIQRFADRGFRRRVGDRARPRHSAGAASLGEALCMIASSECCARPHTRGDRSHRSRALDDRERT